MPDTLYSLSQVSKLTQIPSQTIYAWERRYGAVVPRRTETGRREYTRADLHRLKLLKACIDQGARIGTIAKMSDIGLSELIKVERPVKQSLLLRHALALQQDELGTKFGLALMNLGPAAFADQALAPLMLEIGHRWQEEPQAIAGEHVISAAAKSILFMALRLNRPRASRASAVFATPEGELHELGLLACAVAAQNCGVKATYLGPHMPISQLSHSVTTTDSKILVLACSTVNDTDAIAGRIRQLREDLPASKRLVVGGRCSEGLKHAGLSGVVVLDSVKDFEEFLIADLA
ncbi:hypothetical protein B5K11_24675 [Rhizobium leguminosarum bv. trifolii]|uniref:MerR family transcriptional regulator n=1 Tax=Rhizobium leguminosarum TaxID=384 RepID=UPI000E2F6B73|nr:MerR family transcriptional regulator [Rhizobium leguminosarum]RFB88670.1 hypothetical protein B5K11_24675 [Rhizobium leguminosarum bv. trifolii]